MTDNSLIEALHAPMSSSGEPTWSCALWIGVVNVESPVAERVFISNASGYEEARLLVLAGRRPIGFVHLDIVDGAIDGTLLKAEFARLQTDQRESPCLAAPEYLPAISVVICTRNRPQLLADALDSVLANPYPDFEVVVVDNASDDDATQQQVAGRNDARVRVVREEIPGLAVARNTGVLAATGDLVAFTDDDVVVDPHWLHWLGSTYAANPAVGCITGLVASGEVRTPTQRYFEQQVSWSSSLEREVFDLASPPRDSALFPFQVGRYGTGASFAMPRSTIHQLGGFDEGLGVGSPTGGGEDIDMFVRTLVAKHQLIYEPAALVWHRHRDDMDALRVQARGYGLGLGAWLTKIALSRTLLPLAVRRTGTALAHLVKVTESPDVESFDVPAELRRVQVFAIGRGPWAYAKSRRQGRRPRPLAVG